MKTVVGIDLGTQSLKVVFYDFSAREIVASESAALELYQGDDGAAEQQAHWWLNALKDAIRSAKNVMIPETYIKRVLDYARQGYSSIEFHETVHEDGMARMIRHDSLKVSAGSKLELKRGGPHLMLFNPVKAFRAGDTVNINLTTKDNKNKTITVTVKKAQF